VGKGKERARGRKKGKEERRREGRKGRAVLYEPYHFSIRSAASAGHVATSVTPGRMSATTPRPVA